MLQGVILAAGLGSRIREFHALPKGFIRLGEQPIIQESIEKLHACNITDILIVTGYAANYYDVFVKQWKTVKTLFNPHYHNHASLYSLYCAKEWIKNDFLLLESDIVFEKRALDIILNDRHDNTILLSGQTDSGDEVYVEAVEQRLIRMSKQKETLAPQHIYVEFVGINKIALTDFQKLIHLLDQNNKLLQKGNYDEQGLVALKQYAHVHCLKIPDLVWGEIDNVQQFERAKKLYSRVRDKAL